MSQKKRIDMLFAKSEGLLKEVPGNELPGVFMGLSQIHQRSLELQQKNTRRQTDPNARVFLAERGFPTDSLISKTQELNFETGYANLETVPGSDVGLFLEEKQQDAVVAVVEEAQRATVQRFDENQERFMSSEWDRCKHEVLEALAGQRFLPSSGGRGDGMFGSAVKRPYALLDGAQTPAHGGGAQGGLATPGSARRRGPSGLDSAMASYANVVGSLSDCRIKSKQYALASECLSARRTSAGDTESNGRRSHVTKSWELMKALLNEGPGGSEGTVSGGNTPTEDCYRAYRHGDATIQNLLLKRAKEFLEQNCIEHIEREVTKNQHVVNIGGNPGFAHRVRAYLRIRLMEQNDWPVFIEQVLDDCPLWPQIYYALRCGETELVHSLAGHVSQPPIFQECVRRYLEGQTISDEHCHALKAVSTSDPYKSAVLSILGKFNKYSDIEPKMKFTIEDYLWYHLLLVTDGSSRAADTQYPLALLQATFREHDERILTKDGQQPYLKFRIFLLCQMFEEAVEYLMSVDQCRLDAIHFAVVLNYYGILRTTTNSDSDRHRSRVNFVSYIQRYTSEFSSANIDVALNYLHLLSPATGANTSFKDSVVRVLKETHKFDTVLGVSQADGRRADGLIYKYLKHQTTRFILDVAFSFEEEGLYENAVRIFDLAEDYEKVLEILNKQVGLYLAQARSTSPQRDSINKLANELFVKYERNNLLRTSHTSPNSRTTFGLLHDLVLFFDFYADEKYEEALDVVERQHILAFESGAANSLLSAFNTWEHTIKVNYAEIMLRAMSCIVHLYQRSKAAAPRDQKTLAMYRDKAKTLVAFAGKLMLPMTPTDFHPRLLTMESQLS